MKTVKFYALIGTVLVALLFAGCSKDKDDIVPDTQSTNLTDIEKAGLLEMVEIEKLHQDVYMIMAEKNQCQLFDDLCTCDQNFMTVLSAKIEKYALENPLTERGSGIYANYQVQAKYNEFLNISDAPLPQYLAFARQLEENAVTCVESHIAQIDGNEDIAQIYSNILEESKCQLKSIVTKIEHQDPVHHPGNLPDDI